MAIRSCRRSNFPRTFLAFADAAPHLWMP